MNTFPHLSPKLVKIGVQFLIWLCFILLPYNLWWLAPVGSLLIILLSFAAWPDNNLDRLGLRIPRAQIAISLLIIPVVTASAWLIIDTVAQAQGIALLPIWQKPRGFELAVHTIGQTLNEEMLFGALLLTSITYRFKRVPLLAISSLVAILFTLLHYIFYAWRPSSMVSYGLLSTVTLISIFFVGVLRNNCILGTGNIAYAWAIHLGWNLVFMDSTYYSVATRSLLSEPAIFNAILGSGFVLLAIATATAASILLIQRAVLPSP